MDLPSLRAEAQRALELSEKATKGPWILDQEAIINPDGHQSHIALINDRVLHRYDSESFNGNANLIAASRTLLPKLAEAVIHLCEEREKCVKALKFYADEGLCHNAGLEFYSDESPQVVNDFGTKARETLKEIGD